MINVVFTGFLKMVGLKFDFEFIDTIQEKSNLPSERFQNTYPGIFQNHNNLIVPFYTIEDHTYNGIKKLHLDTELPKYKIFDKSDLSFLIIHSSFIDLYRLAHSLIEKTFEHFNSTATIAFELLKEAGTEVKFDIAQNG